MASRSLDDLLPVVKQKALQWLEECKKAGIEVLIYCTYRSFEEQEELYAIGRTKPGIRVTNARGGQSYHQYRVAWDAVPLKNGKAMWADRESYNKMGEIAQKLGIEWAGTWKTFKETAHFQYNQGLSIEDLKNGKKPQ